MCKICRTIDRTDRTIDLQTCDPVRTLLAAIAIFHYLFYFFFFGYPLRLNSCNSSPRGVYQLGRFLHIGVGSASSSRTVQGVTECCTAWVLNHHMHIFFNGW